MEFMGTTTTTGTDGEPVTLHLYGYTEAEVAEQIKPVKREQITPVWVMPDLSPCAGLLVEGIIEGIGR